MDKTDAYKNIPWLDPARDPDDRAREATQAMTREQKLSWVSGPMAIPA